MKHGFVKVAACTPEVRVADCDFNKKKILECVFEAHKKGAKIIVLPELCVTGATCGDLFLQDILIDKAMGVVSEIADETAEIDAVIAVGMPVSASGKLYNCAAVLYEGNIIGFIPKTNLSKADKRVFTAFDGNRVWTGYPGFPSVNQKIITFTNFVDYKIAFEIGEDGWGYDSITETLAQNGATIICNLSASAEIVGKAEKRRNALCVQSEKLSCGYVLAGAGDGESTTDFVFAGHNIICENGKILAESKLFENEITISEIDVNRLAFERRKEGKIFAGDICYEVCLVLKEPKETQLTRKIPKNPFVPECKKLCDERCSLILTMQAKGLARRIVHTCSKTAVIGISGGLDSTLAILVCVKAMDILKRPHTDVVAVTMPCFGTTKRTRSNAEILCNALGVTFREVDISKSVLQHFEDIGHDKNDHSVTYENSQARERTQVLMDIANQVNGLVVGTGDLSELALGWATYNGDHMSMYGVNGSIPKTLIRHVVRYYGESCGVEEIRNVLFDILDTPVSPELLPVDDKGEMTQKTEDLVGPYELHDFFIYYAVRWGFEPEKIYRMAVYAFDGEYDKKTILHWLKTFFRRFVNQQFKRSCLPDGAKIGAVSLSPRGDFSMPSDACSNLWLKQIDEICKKENIILN